MQVLPQAVSVPRQLAQVALPAELRQAALRVVASTRPMRRAPSAALPPAVSRPAVLPEEVPQQRPQVAELSLVAQRAVASA